MSQDRRAEETSEDGVSSKKIELIALASSLIGVVTTVYFVGNDIINSAGFGDGILSTIGIIVIGGGVALMTIWLARYIAGSNNSESENIDESANRPLGNQSSRDIYLDFTIRLSLYAKIMASVVIDSVFLLIWAAMQWGVHFVLRRLSLVGVDQFVLATIQLVVAVSTLAPIALFILRDLAIIVLRISHRFMDHRRS
jgi:hypothetical protein